MDDFVNILQRDYGLKPQGKSAPMSATKSADPLSSPASIYRTTSTGKSKNGSNRGSRSSTPIFSETLQDDLFFAPNGMKSSSSTRNASGSAGDDLLGVGGGGSGGGASGSVIYDDVFGGPPKFTPPVYTSRPPAATAPPSFDDLFGVPSKPQPSTSNKSSSLPVFDAPYYDDDIFGGVPGIRNTTVAYDDVFGGGSTVGTSPGVLEDLLGGFGISESRDKAARDQRADFVPQTTTTMAGDTEGDELLPGFGGVEPRATADTKPAQDKSFGMTNDSTASTQRPFVAQEADYTSSNVPSGSVSGTDSLKTSIGGSGRKDSSNAVNEDIAPSVKDSPPSPSAPPPIYKPANSGRRRESNSTSPNPAVKGSVDGDYVRKNNHNTSAPKDQHKSSSSSPKPQYMRGTEAASASSPSRRARQVYDKVDDSFQASKSMQGRQTDEFWISVEDVKLVTQPTAAPPPSRPPPVPGSKHNHAPRKPAVSKADSKKNSASDFSEPSFNSSVNSSNDFEELSAGGSKGRKDLRKEAAASVQEDDMTEGSAAASASAAAMKEAMERARAKAKAEKEEREWEVRAGKVRGERERARQAREREENKEEGRVQEEKDKETEREEREREEREREARERRRKEREKEKEREREREREREKDRIAVERATQEARERAERAAVERATAEARERAATEARERAAAERAAVERATAEARERAAAEAKERAAVERATLEARERAAAEARERVERAAVDRAASEARARAERAAVERANAEARERAAERAAADARERAERAAAEKAAAAAREQQQQRRNENDLEAFFSSSSRPGSAPRQRSPSTGDASSKGFSSEGLWKGSAAAPTSGVKKVPSASTISDDWTSLFGSTSTSGEFQEVEGESAERRRARWDRHQRTLERAAKALDEKNQRDLQTKREQEERQRAGDALDAEIKRWAAGKEGNLRALLSTLQYVLWPECGWQAVSLTDLITGAAVKKVYRKATLFVHPDKVQQKGATVQQKYIAEKVFDLLKEAWNKFNSEELF